MGKRRIIFALVFLASAFLISACAAPKKVMIYDSSSELRKEIVRTAISLHGNPYRSGAKGADAFDCSGFVHYVYKRSGIAVPVTTDALIREGAQIPRDMVQPGDLVFFRINGGLHIGIMLNAREFIHASKSRGVATDDVDANYWRRSLQGFRTVLG